jgi:hypothetical protein
MIIGVIHVYEFAICVFIILRAFLYFACDSWRIRGIETSSQVKSNTTRFAQWAIMGKLFNGSKRIIGCKDHSGVLLYWIISDMSLRVEV